MDGFLLVDDSDGRVVAAFDDAEEALRTLDEASKEDPELGETLSLVRFENRHGALLGTETTWRVRVLP